MSDYTPTTDDVAEAWAARYDGEHASASGDERRGYEAEFDRWLAAHDAEVRAAALAEQGDAQVERIARLLARTSAFTQADARVLVKAAQDIAAAEQDTEEPDWEYRVVNKCYASESHETVELARREAGREAGDAIERRRKAGPWMPVEGEAG